MLSEIKKKMKDMNLSFNTDKGEYIFGISNQSVETQDYLDINVDITTSKSTINSKICRLPIPVADNMFEDKGTLYRMVNGLTSRDGFYIGKNGLRFLSRDRIVFKIEFRKNKQEKEYDLYLVKSEKGTNNIPLYKFLIATGCISKREEYNLLFASEMDKIKSAENQNIESQETIATQLLNTVFRTRPKKDACTEFEYKVFDTFFNTGEKWETKSIFFSYARFIGCKLISTKGVSFKPQIITTELARELDLAKVESAMIEIDGEIEEFTPDYGESFTKESLLKVIKLYCMYHRHSLKVRPCDNNAIWNLRLYMYYDYITDYLYSIMSEYANSGRIEPRRIEDFFRYIDRECQKAKETVSVPNSISQASLKYTFAKDIFKDSENFIDQDKQLHMSHLGWVSPSVSADGKKIGLTGCFDANVINDNKLSRKFLLSTGEEKYLEPWETYNKVIAIVEEDKDRTLYMLNGEELQEQIPFDISFNTKDVYDILTGSVVGKNSNQAKRDILGYKAINQSMPALCPELNSAPILKSALSNRKSGKTVREILDEISQRTLGGEKVYNEDSKVFVLKATTYPPDFSKREEDDRRNYKFNKLYIDISVDNISHSYRTLRFMDAATQNVRLYYSISKPTIDDKYYGLDDVLISCGDYEEVGQELNVMFGNIEGSTYEDAVCTLSDFVDSMGFATKVYFHEDLELAKNPVQIVDYAPTANTKDYLDSKGLPKIGTFICKGQLLMAVQVINAAGVMVVKKHYSFRSGYVEEISLTPSYDKVRKVRVMLSEIRKLRKGDKTGNGHGNKGVIMAVLDSSDLVANGKKVDLILNPLGTVGRMNIGQIKEMLSTAICDSAGEAMSFYDVGTEHLSIKELTDILKETGNYEEVDVVYKGERLRNKFFISKIRVYRTEHISSSKLNYTERESLNMNGVVANGQRMSELASLVYSAYGTDNVLKYLIDYQSRTKMNYETLKRNITSGLNNFDAEYNDSPDITPYRINAFLNAIGLVMTKSGMRLMINNDLKNLVVLTNSSIQGDELHSETNNGKFDINQKSGYTMTCKICKPFSIIMPSVLKTIGKIIPLYAKSKAGSKNPLERRGFVIEAGSIGEAIINNKMYCCLMSELVGPNTYAKKIVALESKGKSLSEFREENFGNEWVSGYAGIVSLIKQLDLKSVSENIGDATPAAKIICEKVYKAYGRNFFKDICLDGIPVLPVNLRPVYDGDKSAQGLDKFYRDLMGSSEEKIWDILDKLTTDIRYILTAHQGVKEDKFKGIRSHGEKTSELRDNMFARQLSNSGRSVAGYDFNLGIDEISLPIELAIGMTRSILKSKMCDRIMSNPSSNYYRFIPEVKFGSTDKASILSHIDSKICALLSGVTVVDGFKEFLEEELSSLYSSMTSIMTREPILHRQNSYAYVTKFNWGDCIENNPSVCNSYNLDFDGDQEGIQLVLDSATATEAFLKMSPYNGMFDVIDGKSPFRPFQDILFELYRMTKYSKSEEIRGMYVANDYSEDYTNGAFPSEVKDILSDFNQGSINLCDTVILTDGFYEMAEGTNTSTITETVGNILYVSAMVGKGFLHLKDYTQQYLELSKGGITSNNCNELVTLSTKIAKDRIQKALAKVHKSEMLPYTAQELGYRDKRDVERFNRFYCQDTLSHKHDHIIYLYNSLERMNRAALWVYTIEGITLSPKELSSIYTADLTEKKESLDEELSDSDKLIQQFFKAVQSKSEPLFIYYSGTKLSKYTESLIKESIMTNEFFNDLVTSGARGKIDDFIQMYGVIGDIPYLNKNMYINANYSKGLGIMDKYKLSMPVRLSNVNTQNHLGIDGENLRETCILASRMKTSQKHKCSCKPMQYKIEYDFYLDGEKISDIKQIDVSEDEKVKNLISSLINSSAGMDEIYSGKFIQNLIWSYDLRTLNDKPLTWKINKFSRELISEHILVYNGKEVHGSEVINDIEKTGESTVLMYNIYTCTASDGICKRCYGTMNENLEDSEFRGNIGINTIFSTGKEKVQATLDSAKDSKKKKETVKMSMFDFMIKANVQKMPPCLKVDGLQIKRIAFDKFNIIEAESEVEAMTLDGDDLDLRYLKMGMFIPMGLVNFYYCLGDNKNLERININFLHALNKHCSVKAAEIILGINNRYMAITKKSLDSENPDDAVLEEVAENINEGIVNIDESFDTTKGYCRYWYTKNQVISSADPVTAMCLPEAFGHMFANAMEKKKYSETSVFSDKFAFDLIDEKISMIAQCQILEREYGTTYKQTPAEQYVEETYTDEELLSGVVQETNQFGEYEKEEPDEEDDFDNGILVDTTNEF